MKSIRYAAMAVCVVVVGMTAGCKDTENAVVDAAMPNAEMPNAEMTAPVSIPTPAQAPDTKVVTVNGESLTRAELDKELDMITASPQFAAMPPEQAGAIRKQMESRVVDRYVSQKLLSAAAEAEKVDATDGEVDEFVTGIRGTLPEGVTLESIMEERSISMDKLRQDVGADIKIRKLLEARTKAVPSATDEQIKAYYDSNKEMFTQPESVKARHILVKTDETADEAVKAAAKAKLDGIRAKLVEGTVTFEAAATENSDCPSGKRGGDLGTFARGQMVPAFEEAAFSQEVNAIGPVIETPFGFHVVQVTEKLAAGERSIDQVREEISEQLTMQEKQTAVQDYIEALRAKAEIKYADPQ